MHTLDIDQPIPIHPFRKDDVTGSESFTIARSEGGLIYESDVLMPHRKAYYLLVFMKRNCGGRHWVDMSPYVHKDNTFYFTVPNQILVKEEPTPSWSTHLMFTNEFLALQQNASLRNLPLIQNPQNGHELLLTTADVTFVEEMLDKLYGEYNRPGEWQQPMLSAYLTVFLTYLSRLYTEQFTGDDSAEKLLLKTYQAKIEECFRERHEVGEYASLLNLSAGHLSEVVKVQSGKPAIKHIHERLVLEARRLLFHTQNSLKEIAFDLGFSEASYFNRFFKRETGVTPADYRTTIRKMYQ